MPETAFTYSSDPACSADFRGKADAHGSPPLAEDPSLAALTQEVAACLPLFPVLATQLREAIQQVEQGVVHVCTSFNGMAQRARDAVDQISLDENASGKCGRQGMTQLIGNTRETLSHLLHRIEQTSELSAETVKRMEEIENRINGVKTTLREIDAVAANARLLALNGQIEAARAGKQGAAFAIVATETAKMAVHAVDSSKTIRSLIEALSSEISQASEELRERASADTEEAAQSRVEVNRTLDCMATVHDHLVQAMLQSRENSQRLATDISHAVVAMQFQDAVSQRVGHVITTLEEIREALESKLDGAASPTTSRGDHHSHWTGRMAEYYTMASERHALAEHVTGRGGDTQGMGDNIELF